MNLTKMFPCSRQYASIHVKERQVMFNTASKVPNDEFLMHSSYLGKRHGCLHASATRFACVQNRWRKRFPACPSRALFRQALSCFIVDLCFVGRNGENQQLWGAVLPAEMGLHSFLLTVITLGALSACRTVAE